MIGEKVQHFQGKGTDLVALQQKIEDYLKSDGFSVQVSAPSPHGVDLDPVAVDSSGRCFQ